MKYPEKKIENFTITTTCEKVILDYKKTPKDRFDGFMVLIIGILLSIATYFLILQGIRVTSYITILGGLIFAFQAVYQTISGISRIFQPARNLLVIDKKEEKIIIKRAFFSSKIYPLKEVQTLIVNGQKEKVFTGEQIRRTYCSVNIKLTNSSVEQLFVINTHRFFQASSEKIETELYTVAKQLTTELNRHLKLNCRWSGYHEE